MTSIWLLLGLAVIARAHIVKDLKDDEPEDLEWPELFALKATRMSVTDNVIETYSFWRTPRYSRIDYNDGYVKSIVKINKAYKYGAKFMIMPVAFEDEDLEIICTSSSGSRYNKLTPETILPEETYFFVASGNELILDKDCVKFTMNYEENNSDYRKTVWATYDSTHKIWIPVRYEVLEFSVWLGTKLNHEIWDFYDFTKSFSVRKVFKTESYDCPTDSVNDGSVKNLFFVDPEQEEQVDQMFEAFKADHSKTYADKKEHSIRKSIFKQNMRRVIQHNRKNLGYKLSLNKFADKTPEEMNGYMGLKRRPEGKAGNIPFPYDEGKLNDIVSTLPTEYDLRLQGVVSEVKNQEQCGSCWTFGTTGAVEGALARINGGKLLALSNQAIVDCAWAFGAAGCDGGTDNAAYEWMMKYGLPTEAEYGPYKNQDGVCNIMNMTMLYPIRGYTDVTPLGVNALKVALINHGPLSVSVSVTEKFSLYSSGIFYDPDCNERMLNHEVTLVGYGERDGDTFWILKNSWGPYWGIGGYMYISARDNNCGVATEPTYVVF